MRRKLFPRRNALERGREVVHQGMRITQEMHSRAFLHRYHTVSCHSIVISTLIELGAYLNRTRESPRLSDATAGCSKSGTRPVPRESWVDHHHLDNQQDVPVILSFLASNVPDAHVCPNDLSFSIFISSITALSISSTRHRMFQEFFNSPCTISSGTG